MPKAEESMNVWNSYYKCIVVLNLNDYSSMSQLRFPSRKIFQCSFTISSGSFLWQFSVHKSLHMSETIPIVISRQICAKCWVKSCGLCAFRLLYFFTPSTNYPIMSDVFVVPGMCKNKAAVVSRLKSLTNRLRW